MFVLAALVSSRSPIYISRLNFSLSRDFFYLYVIVGRQFIPRDAPVTTSSRGDKTKRWGISHVDGERNPVARRLTYPCLEHASRALAIAHERLQVYIKSRGGNTTVARKRRPTTPHCSPEGRRPTAANCALYTVVALSRLTPISTCYLHIK